MTMKEAVDDMLSPPMTEEQDGLNQQPLRFLSLPIELRQMIYDYIPLPRRMTYDLRIDDKSKVYYGLQFLWHCQSRKISEAYGDLRDLTVSPSHGMHCDAATLHVDNPATTSNLKAYDDWVSGIGYLNWELDLGFHERWAPIMMRLKDKAEVLSTFRRLLDDAERWSTSVIGDKTDLEMLPRYISRLRQIMDRPQDIHWEELGGIDLLTLNREMRNDYRNYLASRVPHTIEVPKLSWVDPDCFLWRDYIRVNFIKDCTIRIETARPLANHTIKELMALMREMGSMRRLCLNLPTTPVSLTERLFCKAIWTQSMLVHLPQLRRLKIGHQDKRGREQSWNLVLEKRKEDESENEQWMRWVIGDT